MLIGQTPSLGNGSGPPSGGRRTTHSSLVAWTNVAACRMTPGSSRRMASLMMPHSSRLWWDATCRAEVHIRCAAAGTSVRSSSFALKASFCSFLKKASPSFVSMSWALQWAMISSYTAVNSWCWNVGAAPWSYSRWKAEVSRVRVPGTWGYGCGMRIRAARGRASGGQAIRREGGRELGTGGGRRRRTLQQVGSHKWTERLRAVHTGTKMGIRIHLPGSREGH